MIWVEGTNKVRLADADAQVQDTIDATASDVLAYAGGYYYATADTVYRRTTVTTKMGSCDVQTMLAYDSVGALVYWTGSSSDPGALRNEIRNDLVVPLPASTGDILDLVVHDGYAYWTTTTGDLYRTDPYESDGEGFSTLLRVPEV